MRGRQLAGGDGCGMGAGLPGLVVWFELLGLLSRLSLSVLAATMLGIRKLLF